MTAPISAATALAFCVLNVGFALIPGPDVLCIVSNAIARGRRAGWAVCAGIGCALLFHATCAVAGLSALLLAVPTAYLVVKIGGALYLAWIGVRFIRQPVRLAAERAPTLLAHPFAQGAMTNLLNPKIALFAVAILPQFIDPARGHVALQTATLAALWIASGTATNLATATAAAQLRHLLLARPRVFARMQQAAGAALLALAARIALDKAR